MYGNIVWNRLHQFSSVSFLKDFYYPTVFQGTGWWKYEFCYGKHVVQYHVDRAGEKTTLLLGKYDEQAHLDWIKENRGKAPKPKGKT